MIGSAAHRRGRLGVLLAPPGLAGSVGAWLGAALLVWSAIIHLHLWSEGYRHVPTIGPLFLVQGVAGIALAVALAVVRRVLVMMAAAAFALGTIGGLLVTVNVGLFGFRDSLSAPLATESLVVEAVASAALTVTATVLVARGGRSTPAGGRPEGAPADRGAIGRARSS